MEYDPYLKLRQPWLLEGSSTELIHIGTEGFDEEADPPGWSQGDLLPTGESIIAEAERITWEAANEQLVTVAEADHAQHSLFGLKESLEDRAGDTATGTDTSFSLYEAHDDFTDFFIGCEWIQPDARTSSADGHTLLGSLYFSAEPSGQTDTLSYGLFDSANGLSLMKALTGEELSGGSFDSGTILQYGNTSFAPVSVPEATAVMGFTESMSSSAGDISFGGQAAAEGMTGSSGGGEFASGGAGGAASVGAAAGGGGGGEAGGE